MTYSLALRKNGDATIQRIITFLSIASLEDKFNGGGLEENLKQVLLDKAVRGDGYTQEDAAHDSRYLYLQVKHGILSTTETRGQYDYVDERLITPV